MMGTKRFCAIFMMCITGVLIFSSAHFRTIPRERRNSPAPADSRPTPYSIDSPILPSEKEDENSKNVTLAVSGYTVVRKTTDFEVDGAGEAVNWRTTEWIEITLQESANDIPIDLKTRAKILYSETGIYFLIVAEDQKLSATINEDFGPLFREDVIEVFLWPDPSVPIYFEYELSPLNYELAYLVPNINGKFQGWRPVGYDGQKRTRHATSVQGGEKKSHSGIKSWTGEVFIPYDLLSPLVQSPPKPGTLWRANLYRIDYDQGYTSWTWQKTTPKLRGSLHEFKKFGTLIFE